MGGREEGFEYERGAEDVRGGIRNWDSRGPGIVPCGVAGSEGGCEDGSEDGLEYERGAEDVRGGSCVAPGGGGAGDSGAGRRELGKAETSCGETGHAADAGLGGRPGFGVAGSEEGCVGGSEGGLEAAETAGAQQGPPAAPGAPGRRRRRTSDLVFCCLALDLKYKGAHLTYPFDLLTFQNLRYQGKL